MLVLSRRANESLMIGDDVVITVLEVRGDQVRLGIRAPRSVAVHREEVFAELVKQNQEAANPDAESLGALDALRPATRDEDPGPA